jgi:hypothetical protein
MAGATAERASDLYLVAGRGVDCGDCRIGKGCSDHLVGERVVDALGQPVRSVTLGASRCIDCHSFEEVEKLGMSSWAISPARV